LLLLLNIEPYEILNLNTNGTISINRKFGVNMKIILFERSLCVAVFINKAASHVKNQPPEIITT